MPYRSENFCRLSALVLMALAVRALIPPGFMLATAEASGGGLTVVICTAQGMQSVSLDADGKPVEAPASQRADSGCAFGPVPPGIAADDPDDVVFSPPQAAAPPIWSGPWPTTRRVSRRRARAPPMTPTA
ncbi:MAG: DUF2946 family protein [Pseudomonadota bacterium]